MTLTFAPSFVNLPSAAILDLELGDVHFRTLVFFHGLAWRTKGERTPPVTIDDLMPMRGLSRSKMFEHISILKAAGYIKTDYIGNGAFVVYLLRQEPGAALPTDERADLTDEELAILAGGGASSSPGNGIHSPENGTHHDHDVVVLNHDSDQEQQQHVMSPENGTQPRIQQAFEASLLDGMVGIFTGNGMDHASAEALALKLLGEVVDGRVVDRVDICRRQLAAFERRCELARASKRGLENPIGLLCQSIEKDWPLPAAKLKEKTWFDGYEDFFER